MNYNVTVVSEPHMQIKEICQMMEQRGIQANRIEIYPHRFDRSDALLFIEYTKIPRDGADLPAFIPTLAYQRRETPDRVRLPQIEVMHESEHTYEEVAERIEEKIAQHIHAKEMRLTYRDMLMDQEKRYVKVRGESLSLSDREFNILMYLMQNQGQILTRKQIQDRVWGYEFDTDNKVVDVYIRHIRVKMNEQFGRNYITTIRGKGYSIGYIPGQLGS